MGRHADTSASRRSVRLTPQVLIALAVAAVVLLAGGITVWAVNAGDGDCESTAVVRLAVAPELVKDLTGSDSPVEFIDLPVDDPKVRRPDISRAEELLGWRPSTPVREGLSRTVRWMAAERTPAATA